MASPGGFDPNAAIAGSTGTANPFTGSGAASGDFAVYAYSGSAGTGDQNTYDGGSVNAAEYGGESHLVQVSAQQYTQNYLTSIGDNPDQIKSLQEQLQKAGYNVTPTGVMDQDTQSAYMAMLADVSAANGYGNLVTPEDYLNQRATTGAASGGTKSSTSTNFTDVTTARDTAEQVFQAELGKKPDQKQLDAFYAALHAYEAANPSVTTASSTGNNATSTTSGGAATPSAFAQQYVEQNYGPQVGQHDALHYFDLIASALNGPPSGVSEVV